MNDNIRFWIGLIGVVFLSFGPLEQSAAQLTVANSVPRTSVVISSGTHTIKITDLGLPPGYVSARALAINNLGQVVGMATDSSFVQHRIIWDRGTFIELPNFDPSSTAVPEGINDAREVVGSEPIGANLEYGVYWDAAGHVSALQPIPGGPVTHVNGHGINNSGQLVGFSQEGGPGRSHAVRWPNGLSAPQDLGFLGSGQFSEAHGINDLGEVVGAADNGTVIHAFLWQNGTYTDLGSLGGAGAASVAYVINNSTVVAGSSNGGFLSFVWRNGVMTQLPFPPGVFSSSVFDINNADDIVGEGTSSQQQALLWRNGEAIDLGTWPGGTVSLAHGINDSGTIVGEGNLSPGGFLHALMWTVDGGGGIPCGDLVSFQVRCKSGGGGQKLQAKLTLTDTSHSGEQVTITVDGNPRSVTINGNKAQLSINNPASGEHTIELTDPAGCFPPRVPSCN